MLFEGKTCANLLGANLSNANLSNANLYGADLSCANFSRANLSNANLSYANLSRQFMYWARHPDIEQIDDPQTPPIVVIMEPVRRCADPLTGTNLSRANLSNANLFNAELRGTIMPDGSIQR